MSPFTDYLAAIRKNLSQGDATEGTHRPAIKALIEAVGKGISATNEPKRIRCGAPDFNIARGKTPLGHIETKDIGTNLDEIERSRGPHGNQFARYRDALPNWILTDYLEFRWFVNGEKRLAARIAQLDSRSNLRPIASGEAAVAQLLEEFLKHKALTVRTAKDLAQRLAALARIMRDLIVNTFEHESKNGWLHNWLTAFRQVLIPDLDESQFADMFAQTLAYGLFAARIHTPAAKEFSRQMAAFMLPKTNPFLRKLFAEIAGVDMPETIDWAVDDVVELLKHAAVSEIVEDFGKGKGKEDPVVHFYETFLGAYNQKLREVRGVYYTPEPVVGYIVRSVDHLLRTRFGRTKGLADENTLILDPAVGTATFLYFVMEEIHRKFAKQRGAWNKYVAAHLLSRVFGFEILMAPYAVAHLKLGMQLQRTGYSFRTDQRLGIYLTNTLEEAAKKSEKLFANWVSEEANAAAKIKKDMPIMVVLGNPPYSGISANRGEWITKLITDYRTIDGKALGEKKVWLKNDYIKFIRFGQWRIERTGYGILAFITDHSYLDSPTFRGMRRNLLKTFDEIFILNLHGNAKRREKTPSGGKDDNVFDITQGVAIGLFLKQPQKCSQSTYYADLWGTRETKYGTLAELDVSRTDWQMLTPSAPFFELVPVRLRARSEYLAGWSVTDIFPTGSNGVQTSRDSLVVAFEREELVKKIEQFADPNRGETEVRQQFFGDKSVGDYLPGDTREWKVDAARATLQKSPRWREAITSYLYRPFDRRALLYLDSMVDWPRRKVMRHLEEAGYALCVGRAGLVATGTWDLVFCAKEVCDHNLFYRGSSLNLPLFLYPDGKPTSDLFSEANGRRANLSGKFVFDLVKRLRLEFLADAGGNSRTAVGPDDVFSYVYAVLHSPAYRTRYAEFLKTDFPRVPLTTDLKLFAALVERGRKLAALHLMEYPELDNFLTEFPEAGDDLVERVRYDEAKRRIWINEIQYFGEVPQDIWEFHLGGFQVCEKWLKDRTGRRLAYAEIQHYQKIIVAIEGTLSLMKEIDQVIKTYGGWPLRGSIETAPYVKEKVAKVLRVAEARPAFKGN